MRHLRTLPTGRCRRGGRRRGAGHRDGRHPELPGLLEAVRPKVKNQHPPARFKEPVGLGQGQLGAAVRVQVGVAAVADWAVANSTDKKIKKDDMSDCLLMTISFSYLYFVNKTKF